MIRNAKVKWWHRKRGYGFLIVDGIDQDVFVHWRGLLGDGYRNLEDDQRVTCRVIQNGTKGLLAVDVLASG